jgi:hypothetical protein
MNKPICRGVLTKTFAQPSIRITGRRKEVVPGSVITAIVAANLILMIVCFQRKQWDGLLLTYRHLCAKLVITPPVNGENGGVRYED